MSGFAGLILASKDFDYKYAYTIIDTGGSAFGNQNGNFSPSSAYKTRAIGLLNSLSGGGGYDIHIDIVAAPFTGDPGQAYFSTLLIEDSTGAWRTYTSASAATYLFQSNAAGLDHANWLWGTGSNRVYPAVSGTTRHAILVP